ncbi:MAG TPA: hypothetical protein VLN47_05825 [Clostridiaceae bacterium]|nr:hypothetical protein [Clostridiaceae bacterium]
MSDSIMTILKVEASIGINAILYFLKKFPLLKTWLRNVSYTFLGLKRFIGYVSVLFFLIYGTLKSLLFFVIFVFLPGLLPAENMSRDSMTLVFFLYFAARLLQSDLLELNNQKFVMVKELRMNPGQYARAFLVKKEGFRFVSRSAVLMVFSGILGISPIQALTVSIFAVMTGLAAETLHLIVFRRTGKTMADHNVLLVLLYILIPGIGYLLFFFLPGFHPGTLILHPLAWLFFIGLGIAAARYLFQYPHYGEAMNRATNFLKLTELGKLRKDAKFADVRIKAKDFDASELTPDAHKEKEGYAYLNALFFDRHKRIIRKPVLIKSALVSGVFIIFLVVSLLISPDLLLTVSNGILGNFTIFIFLMYMLCNSNRETKAMFYNCDLSMLKYGFYRKPGALLKMFALRTRRIVLGNMVPTLLLVGGLLLVTTLSGQRNYMEILPVLAMIISLSVFFSVHFIFMYYIFQPYTSTMDVKNPFFNIINGLVYFLSYMSMQIDEPAARFVWYIVVFALLYVAMAVTLVYRMAPKTFRVK